MQEFFKNNYIIIILLSIATVLCFVWLFFFNKEKLKAKTWEIILIVFLHTLLGVGFVKLFAIMEAGFNASKAGSMSLYGGIFFMPILYFIYAKLKKLPVGLVFDTFVVCLAATLMIARINCLFSGCCLGKFIDSNYTVRFPSREIELAAQAIFVGLAIFFIMRNKLGSKLYPAYMVYYGVFRFIIEFFRESSTEGPFHIAHLWSAIAVIAGVTIIIIQLVMNKKPVKK